jgi:hypothetical protein
VQFVQGQHPQTEDFVVLDQMPEPGTTEIAVRRVGIFGNERWSFLNF